MKALVLETYNSLNYKEVEIQLPRDHEVLVNVMAAGICGSDALSAEAPLKDGAEWFSRLYNKKKVS